MRSVSVVISPAATISLDTDEEGLVTKFLNIKFRILKFPSANVQKRTIHSRSSLRQPKSVLFIPPTRRERQKVATKTMAALAPLLWGLLAVAAVTTCYFCRHWTSNFVILLCCPFSPCSCSHFYMMLFKKNFCLSVLLNYLTTVLLYPPPQPPSFLAKAGTFFRTVCLTLAPLIVVFPLHLTMGWGGGGPC